MSGKSRKVYNEGRTFQSAFVNKLRLYETQQINSNFARFPNLGLCKPANSDKYVLVIVSTKTQFESRFGDIKK